MKHRTLIIILFGAVLLWLLGSRQAPVAGFRPARAAESYSSAESASDEPTPTATSMQTPTNTPTHTSTPTNTSTPTSTSTPSMTPTATATPTSTPVTPTVIAPRDYLTAPSDLPKFTARQWPGEAGEGYFFVSMFNQQLAGEVTSYNLILDNNGEPIYYQPLTPIISSNDFKKQPNGLLTYFAPVAKGDISYIALNNRYEVVKKYMAGKDPNTGQVYVIDNHDIQLLDNGHAMILIHDTRIIDMSAVFPGGSKEANVIGCIIQEIDENNDVVFQWRSWDHMFIQDTYEPLDSNPLRYIHCNAVEVDSDGNLLLSSRNINEVTKIDRQTGEIIWRMGGRNNEFKFDISNRFSEQHDVRRLANGRMTIYHNASWADRRPSRGVEYFVDEVRMIVEEVKKFANTPPTYGPFMGNMQRLPDGNSVIGWGNSSKPVLTEFDQDGDQILELSSADGMISYRAFRFPWQGDPPWPPVLAAKVEGNTVHLHFSWNGSTDTAAYLINAGPTLRDILPIARVERKGFETTYSYDLPDDGFWYFRVRPIREDGFVGRRSYYVVVIAGAKTVNLPVVMR